ncbi:MAG: TIM-barrel domain-containing protein [Solirubrobacteraceae bacterium]
MPGRAWVASALVIGALVIGAGPATAATVSAHVRPIVVRVAGGAVAVITRSPFRISFLTARGQVVLREAASASAPFPVPPVSQSEFGTIGPPPPTLYAPMSFLVGTEEVTQEQAGQWEGTLHSVTQSGIEYSAQSVVAVRRRGRGVLLTVSTDDPSGRRLMIRVAPGGAPDAISVTATTTSPTGVAGMADSFLSGRGEAFYGLGGRHDYLNQRGQEFYNWLEQEDVGSGSAQGLTKPTEPGRDRYMFPNGASAAYYVQSSLVSSRGYGFLLKADQISQWRLDSERSDRWQAQAATRALRYVVAVGSAPRAIAELTRLTGRQPVPPAWAAGSQYDRLVQFPSDPPAQYEHEVQSDIANIDRHHLHVDAYRLEGWAELPTRVLRHFIAELKARGIHPLVYFRAFVGTDTTGTDTPAAYNYALAHGYVATYADGRPYTFVSNFARPGAQIDFTNPAAVRWWKGRIRAALNLGADGFMQDFGEQVLADMHFHDGETGATMHNRLPVLYDRATRQAVKAYERAHPGRRIFFYTRAGYTGTPGDAAYEGGNFPGDETTDWSRASGLASLTTDMLSRAIGGAYGYTTDIGGYFDVGPFQPTTKELFLRWAEWAALSPLFRLHGSVQAGTHAPWTFDRRTVKLYKALTALHLRARSLILRLWSRADRTGMPVTRPLWLQYPRDPGAARQDQEWLLGPEVLVAPVVTQGATSRRVYFPRGCWRSPGSGFRFHGPVSRAVAAPLARLPYFFKCGTHPFAAGPRRAGHAERSASL